MMAPEVVLRKLAHPEQLLRDLAPYEDASLEQVEQEHYKIERILVRLATASSDLPFHLLAERDMRPESCPEAFRMAAEQGLISAELGESLAQATAMRNILVHPYERSDYSILHSSMRPALRDYGAFVTQLADTLN